MQSDVERIVELYRAHGYFDARVEPRTIIAKNDRVNLVFEIEEGDKLAVREIRFAGNNAFREQAQRRGQDRRHQFLSFPLNNDTYDADKIENDRDLLRQFYRAHGYADVACFAPQL